MPASHGEAERLALTTRKQLGLSDEPLHDLGARAEQLGVVAFSIDVGDTGEGACVELTSLHDRRLGVAVINGNQDPGRRRWTLAHELGHFLVGDAYAADHPAGDIEKYLNSFVAHLLMPRTGVDRLWRATADRSARVTALTLSARYRTSWSAACSHLRNLGYLDHATCDRLRSEHPTSGDYLALGETWTEELRQPFVPPGYTQRVLTAYVQGRLTSARTVELIRSTLDELDLPSPTPPSLEDLRSVIEPLP